MRFLLFLFFMSASLWSGAFLEVEQKKAMKEKKFILLNVGSERCPFCIKMKKNVYDHPTYSKMIAKNYVYVEVMHDEMMLPSRLHVKYLPTHYILSPKDLSVLDEFNGYVEPVHFMELLDEVYRQEAKFFSKP